MQFKIGDIIHYKKESDRLFKIVQMGYVNARCYADIEVTSTSILNERIGTTYYSQYISENWVLYKRTCPQGHPLTKIFK